MYRLRHDKVTMFFGFILLLIVLAAISAPLLSPFDPYKESIIGRLKPLGWKSHWLGTDELGCDLLTRLLYGGRISLLMGVVPVCIATLVGGTLGIVGGFAGKRVNTLIMRTMDVFYAFPSVLLVVAISGAMGGGIANGMIALSMVFTPRCAASPRRRRPRSKISTSWKPRATPAPVLSPSCGSIFWEMELGPVFIYASSLVSVGFCSASGPVVFGSGRQPPIADRA